MKAAMSQRGVHGLVRIFLNLCECFDIAMVDGTSFGRTCPVAWEAPVIRDRSPVIVL
jgi:hypothetical protein